MTYARTMLRPALRRVVVAGSLVPLLATTACASGGGGAVDDVDAEATVKVHSDDLQQAGDVPIQFTCDGDDVAPALAWSELPDATEEVVVVVDDPDAPGGTFTHWTVWGLAPSDSLEAVVPAHAVEGTNGFGTVGYRGPCPPRGDSPHRYRFRVLALDTKLDLEDGARSDVLADAIDGHVLGEGVLEATFGH